MFPQQTFKPQIHILDRKRKEVMRKTLLITFSCLLALHLFTVSAKAQKLKQHGREIEILWNQRGSKKIHVWGSITKGGYFCKQIRYRIQLENSSNGIRRTLKGYVRNYKPNHRNQFEATAKIRKSKELNDWFLNFFDFNCLDDDKKK